MMNLIYILLALGFASLQAWAVYKANKRLEYLAKPAVMVFLLAWVTSNLNLQGAPLWFVIGLVFCLAGDIFLMFKRFFMPGLVAFLFGHIAYILAFNTPLPDVNLFSLGMAIFIAILGGQLFRKLEAGLRKNQQLHMKTPVILYSVVISIMLLSALVTLFRLDWQPSAALLVSAGAILFYVSDLVLAFNRFVNPIHHGRLINIGIYHAGQIALAAGFIIQFS